MMTYFMFGCYTPEAIKGASPDRTGKVVSAVKKCGGEVKEIFALMGDKDLVIITEFPSNDDAVKASINLGRATGISFSTVPAMSVEKFDKMLKEV